MEKQYRIREVPPKRGAPRAWFVMTEDNFVVCMCGAKQDAELIVAALSQYEPKEQTS